MADLLIYIVEPFDSRMQVQDALTIWGTVQIKISSLYKARTFTLKIYSLHRAKAAPSILSYFKRYGQTWS